MKLILTIVASTNRAIKRGAGDRIPNQGSTKQARTASVPRKNAKNRPLQDVLIPIDP